MQDTERRATNRLTTLGFELGLWERGGYEAVEALAGEVAGLRKPSHSSNKAAAEVAAKLLQVRMRGDEGKSLWGPERFNFCTCKHEVSLIRAFVLFVELSKQRGGFINAPPAPPAPLIILVTRRPYLATSTLT
jgi:hypothetical protein